MTVRLLMFAAAREAAGRSSDTFDPGPGATIATVLDLAVARYGESFDAVVRASRIWCNGDEPPDGPSTEVGDGDEVAVLPPVSGGAG